jgi:hypothetical protein
LKRKPATGGDSRIESGFTSIIALNEHFLLGTTDSSFLDNIFF